MLLNKFHLVHWYIPAPPIFGVILLSFGNSLKLPCSAALQNYFKRDRISLMEKTD